MRYGHLRGLTRNSSYTDGLLFAFSRLRQMAVTGCALLSTGGTIVLVGLSAGRSVAPSPADAATGLLWSIGVVPLGVVGLLGIAACLSPRGGIVLVPDGVFVRTLAGGAWIRWDDLAEVRVTFTCIHLRACSPERVTLTGLNRRLHGGYRGVFGADVGAVLAMLPDGGPGVADHIRHYWLDPAARARIGNQ